METESFSCFLSCGSFCKQFLICIWNVLKHLCICLEGGGNQLYQNWPEVCLAICLLLIFLYSWTHRINSLAFYKNRPFQYKHYPERSNILELYMNETGKTLLIVLGTSGKRKLWEERNVCKNNTKMACIPFWLCLLLLDDRPAEDWHVHWTSPAWYRLLWR